MAALTTLILKRTANGVDLAGVAAAGGGDTFVNTGKESVVIKNGGGAPITLTIAAPTLVDSDLAVAARTATIAAGATRAVGPFPNTVYGDTVSLTYSAVTSVTVAILANPS